MTETVRNILPLHLIRVQPRQEVPAEPDYAQMLDEIRHEKQQAYARFNNAATDEQLEATIYEINAIEHRFNHLLKQAKLHRKG